MVNLHKAVALAGSAALALAVGGCDRLGHHRGDWHGHHAKADVGAIKDAIKADLTKWNDEFHANPKSVDALVAQRLSLSQLDDCFDDARFLAHVHVVMARLDTLSDALAARQTTSTSTATVFGAG